MGAFFQFPFCVSSAVIANIASSSPSVHYGVFPSLRPQVGNDEKDAECLLCLFVLFLKFEHLFKQKHLKVENDDEDELDASVCFAGWAWVAHLTSPCFSFVSGQTKIYT